MFTTKFILIWSYNDYEEMGGGTWFELYDNLELMDTKVNSLLNSYGNKLSIDFSGQLREIFNYEPVEKIIKLERRND